MSWQERSAAAEFGERMAPRLTEGLAEIDEGSGLSELELTIGKLTMTLNAAAGICSLSFKETKKQFVERVETTTRPRRGAPPSDYRASGVTGSGSPRCSLRTSV